MRSWGEEFCTAGAHQIVLLMSLDRYQKRATELQEGSDGGKFCDQAVCSGLLPTHGYVIHWLERSELKWFFCRPVEAGQRLDGRAHGTSREPIRLVVRVFLIFLLQVYRGWISRLSQRRLLTCGMLGIWRLTMPGCLLALILEMRKATATMSRPQAVRGSIVDQVFLLGDGL